MEKEANDMLTISGNVFAGPLATFESSSLLVTDSSFIFYCTPLFTDITFENSSMKYIYLLYHIKFKLKIYDLYYNNKNNINTIYIN